MPESQPLQSIEATDKLLAQFEYSPDLLDSLVSTGETYEEAACAIVTAGGHVLLRPPF
jgi:hypothetical protein